MSASIADVFVSLSMTWRPLLLLLVAISAVAGLNPFNDKTATLLGSPSETGIAAGFGDVNADRRVDILVMDVGLRDLDVIIMKKEGAGKRQRLVSLPSSVGTKLIGVVPADFNGDSRLDIVLLTGPASGGGPVEAFVAYGTPNRLALTTPVSVGATFKEQPALVDWNGDMIADLMGEDKDSGSTVVMLGSTFSNFTKETFPFSAWDKPGFSAFVDVNKDRQPDVLITTKKEYQFILKDPKTNKYETGKPLHVNKPGPNMKVIGSPVFYDFYQEDRMLMLVPACKDDKCGNSVFHMYDFDTKKWTTLDISFKASGHLWGFVTSADNSLSELLPVPLMVRVGDVDLDGYPDIVAILKRTDIASAERQVGLFLGRGKGKFELKLPVGYNASLVGMFDYHDTGRLGFLLVGGSPPRLTALMQGDREDGYFLKVMVLNGLCGGPANCPEGHPPYGLPVPGPIAKYNTERPEGGRQFAMAEQITQSSFLALQLPFSVFGLGSFSNYIEKLDVYLPNQVGKTVNRQKEFTFIVPKTQLVVLPYPLNQPSKSSFFLMGESGPRWKNRLFLEPFRDKKVLYVAAALLGTIILVAIITGILQWRERREDFQEKLQEAQKFHFDAM